MPTGKPTTGFFYKSAGAAISPLVCISIKKYGEKYFLSRKQIKLLLAKKILCGVRFKGRLYIADSPPKNLNG